ncbi:hypothetical protein COB18_00215 [Candidatus Kaiserbacteria bacterium]|nr:MAG: hypothetical protein COB18_00215 [Candidatus Kaiserbacteria bacterium]
MEDNKGQKLQAVLYGHGGEMKKSELLSLLNISSEELVQFVGELKQLTVGQGVELFETETTLSLRTASAYSDFVTELHKKDIEKDIGTAGLEVLAIVLYKNGCSRTTIDYIRGVNSSGTLRQLILRGLLERTRIDGDSRGWQYSTTPELLAHIGITIPTELPEYEELSVALAEPTQVQSLDDA